MVKYSKIISFIVSFLTNMYDSKVMIKTRLGGDRRKLVLPGRVLTKRHRPTAGILRGKGYTR